MRLRIEPPSRLYFSFQSENWRSQAQARYRVSPRGGRRKQDVFSGGRLLLLPHLTASRGPREILISSPGFFFLSSLMPLVRWRSFSFCEG